MNPSYQDSLSVLIYLLFRFITVAADALPYSVLDTGKVSITFIRCCIWECTEEYNRAEKQNNPLA